MKLLQLNVWQNRLHKQVMKFVEDEQPDILCLQELSSTPEVHPLFPGFSGLEAFKLSFPEYYVYFAPCFSAPVFGGTCLFGNAILSRYPITKQETVFINGEYQDVEIPTFDTTNTRNLQCTTIQTPQGEFQLLNHHGYWVPNQFGDEISIERMKAVAAIVHDTPPPLILAGDLNVVAESPAMQPLHAELRDLTEEHKIRTTLSPLGKVRDVACDHICISESIRVESFTVANEIVSDHLPLIMTFDLDA